MRPNVEKAEEALKKEFAAGVESLMEVTRGLSPQARFGLYQGASDASKRYLDSLKGLAVYDLVLNVGWEAAAAQLGLTRSALQRRVLVARKVLGLGSSRPR